VPSSRSFQPDDTTVAELFTTLRVLRALCRDAKSRVCYGRATACVNGNQARLTPLAQVVGSGCYNERAVLTATIGGVPVRSTFLAVTDHRGTCVGRTRWVG
jgi:hypothetical protein